MGCRVYGSESWKMTEKMKRKFNGAVHVGDDSFSYRHEYSYQITHHPRLHWIRKWRYTADASATLGILWMPGAYALGQLVLNKFFLHQIAPAHSRVPPVAAEGDTSQEVPSILALSETHNWRSDTDAIFSEQPENGDPYSGCCICLSTLFEGGLRTGSWYAYT